MRRNRILLFLFLALGEFRADCRGGRHEERFDLETVEKHVLQPEYSASAEIRWCLSDPVEAYVMVGASVEAAGMDMRMKNVKRKGTIRGDTAPLDRISGKRRQETVNRRR